MVYVLKVISKCWHPCGQWSKAIPVILQRLASLCAHVNGKLEVRRNSTDFNVGSPSSIVLHMSHMFLKRTFFAIFAE